MKILVINAGSSSLKYQLIDMENEFVLAKGVCERIGDGGSMTHKTHDGKKMEAEKDFPTHKEAFVELIDVLTKGEYAVIDDVNEISAVGHRIVQGAEKFSKSVLVTEEVVNTIESIADLAPLHNPAHVLAIRACMNVFDKHVPQVVVFDTAFHQTMPKTAYMFGVPYEYYEKYHVRRYGFHGTSHRYVSRRFAKLIGKKVEDLKMITCHLGNGSSITAIDGGKSVDTSMGFTPLDGILMGTRSGNVDPSVITYIAEKENMSGNELSLLLNKKSGFLGISGRSSDHRDMIQFSNEGDERSKLVLDMLYYQIRKYIGAYTAVMGGLDALVFTGGIGENSYTARESVCRNMDYFGIKLDKEINQKFNRTEHEISSAQSRVKIWIVPTNEELMIARDTKAIVDSLNQ
ncbi:acetate/propionate family kinase [Candidatus Soleaferrea massiliensis]|uniref:acetate/propionate family kinase n=1 Tax=Candidatus Soleaferrea massiliensis TaxID=1470354 RepID=UPI00058C3367|nr:acetate kinase [Candidatus Soleaferrea massiliensis]